MEQFQLPQCDWNIMSYPQSRQSACPLLLELEYRRRLIDSMLKLEGTSFSDCLNGHDELIRFVSVRPNLILNKFGLLVAWSRFSTLHVFPLAWRTGGMGKRGSILCTHLALNCLSLGRPSWLTRVKCCCILLISTPLGLTYYKSVWSITIMVLVWYDLLMPFRFWRWCWGTSFVLMDAMLFGSTAMASGWV